MFEPGSQIGRYEIQRRLGRGGMGSVHVAHDPVLGRMVAIKVFDGDLDLPDARERFAREARAAAALSHPHIVTVYDFGEYDSQPYIVMEYVAGETLAGIIRRKVPVSMADKLRWLEELCAGAGYAHQMHLVHRDIKPANLIVDRTGRLKILDFGIARLLGIASNTSVMVGTPGYMAPEQITGDPVDHRADQFSIGVVGYELLAYTEAFPGDSMPMITNKILNEHPVPLQQLTPEVPAELAGIVAQAISKSADDRFPDTETLRVAISRVRKQFSSSAAFGGQTVIVNRETPPPGGGSRGTGSARHRDSDAVSVAQMTPPPDSRRTDREAIARRRAAQLESALQQARVRLAEGQLEAALDACQQALTFDETHAGALELEHEIEAALRQREQAGVSRPTSSPTVAADSPADPGTGLDEALKAAGIAAGPSSGPSDRTVLRVPTPPPDATVVAPHRRTPPPASPWPAAAESKAGPIEPVAPAVPDPPAPPVSAPVAKAVTADAAPGAPVARVAKSPPGESVRKSAKAPAARPVDRKASKTPRPGAGVRVAEILANVQTRLDSARVVVVKKAAADRRVTIGVAAAAVLLAAAAAGWMMSSGPAPTGAVVIDAAPWAVVTAVRSEDGELQPLPEETSTPLSLTLPAGTYAVTLTGPPPESTQQQITVTVDADGSSVAPSVRFRAVTPEEYFEQYLASPGSGSDAAAPEAPPEAPPELAVPAAPAGATP